MIDSTQVTSDSVVSLNFAIQLKDGSIVDSNFDQAPCTFSFGDGSLLPGFEKALLGLRVGERKSMTIEAEDGFGEWQADRQTQLPMNRFKDLDLEPGLVISFSDPSGERPGVVKEILNDEVVIDFNHPLAGQGLVFDVLIHSVETSTR